MPYRQVRVGREPESEEPFGHQVGIEHPLQADQAHPVLLEAFDLGGHVEFGYRWRGGGRGPERPPIASRSRVAAAGSSAAVMAATARAARAACSGSTDVSMLSSCPGSLARAWCASALARVDRPARSASSAASAAHQGEPGGAGLVARAASRRARLDNVPAEPGVGRERMRSGWLGCCVGCYFGHHARRLRTEQLDKHRCYLLTDRDGPVGPGGIDYHSAQTAIGTVEGQVQTRHGNQRGFSCHPCGEALEDHLAGLALKTRREVHDYNSTP